MHLVRGEDDFRAGYSGIWRVANIRTLATGLISLYRKEADKLWDQLKAIGPQAFFDANTGVQVAQEKKKTEGGATRYPLRICHPQEMQPLNPQLISASCQWDLTKQASKYFDPHRSQEIHIRKFNISIHEFNSWWQQYVYTRKLQETGGAQLGPGAGPVNHPQPVPNPNAYPTSSNQTVPPGQASPPSGQFDAPPTPGYPAPQTMSGGQMPQSLTDIRQAGQRPMPPMPPMPTASPPTSPPINPFKDDDIPF